MSGSKTIIADEERLANVHPGDVLREDFLIGAAIDPGEVAAGTGIPIARLSQLLAGKTAIDADADLRLTRYFGMSEGFFLRLQNDYDLEEARRANGVEIEKIVRRAA